MNAVTTFWRSTVGKKIVMAVTGIILIAFIIVHLVANLLVFAGPERINAYAAFLKSTGELLWLARAVLLVAAVLHIVAAYQLTRIDRSARPVGYARYQPQASTAASRSMRVGGVIILLFVIFHLLHLTTGTIEPVPFSGPDVYANVVGGFRIWWVTLIYLVGMIALGFHLFHGAWSSFRTIGAVRPRTPSLRHQASTVIAFLVWLGFTVIPLAVFVGVVR